MFGMEKHSESPNRISSLSSLVDLGGIALVVGVLISVNQSSFRKAIDDKKPTPAPQRNSASDYNKQATLL